MPLLHQPSRLDGDAWQAGRPDNPLLYIIKCPGTLFGAGAFRKESGRQGAEATSLQLGRERHRNQITRVVLTGRIAITRLKAILRPQAQITVPEVVGANPG
jgi:hypothetical protein